MCGPIYPPKLIQSNSTHWVRSTFRSWWVGLGCQFFFFKWVQCGSVDSQICLIQPDPPILNIYYMIFFICSFGLINYQPIYKIVNMLLFVLVWSTNQIFCTGLVLCSGLISKSVVICVGNPINLLFYCSFFYMSNPLLQPDPSRLGWTLMMS